MIIFAPPKVLSDHPARLQAMVKQLEAHYAPRRVELLYDLRLASQLSWDVYCKDGAWSRDAVGRYNVTGIALVVGVALGNATAELVEQAIKRGVPVEAFDASGPRPVKGVMVNPAATGWADGFRLVLA